MITTILDMIAKAATRYLDKVILSHTLARDGGDPWHSAEDRLIYYGQNATAILKTSVRIVVLDRLASVVVCALLLVLAVASIAVLPEAVR